MSTIAIVWGVNMVRTIMDSIKRDLFSDDLYYEEVRQALLENDEISMEEDAFMRGYDDAG